MEPMNRCITLGLLLTTASYCCAQELDPHDPAMISDGLNRSSVVVIGKFDVEWCWPWFDGWHCSGAIHVEESLYGHWKVNEAVPFRWREHYGPTCFICTRISRLDGDKAIWFVSKKDGAWRFSGPHFGWCDEGLPLDCRDAVIRCIRQRGRK